MKVYYSNKLEVLADMLRDFLFFNEMHPFAKRRIVVPDAAVKNYLLLRWAKDPKLGIASGVKVTTWGAFTDEFLPSKLALSLRIERELNQIDDKALRSYLSRGGLKRKTSLADHLSDLFLRYHLYGGDKLKEGGWQKEIWERVWKVDDKAIDPPTALFHFNWLPKRYFRYFPRVFCLSPSEMFWGDFYSPREQEYFPALKEYFQEQHPFLTNFGKLGREFLRNLEDVESEDRYAVFKGKSVLETVQREISSLTVEKKRGDDSIQIHAAPSKLREVEVVFELVYKLGGAVTVYAPDINAYAPYIHMVFGGRSDYSIFNLELRKESFAAKGLELLLEIGKKNLCKKDILRLLEIPNFCEKFGFFQKEIAWIHEWRPWEGIIELFATTPVMDMAEGETIGKWLGVIELLTVELKKLSEKKTVYGWMVYFRKLVEQFFVVHPKDEALMRCFQNMAYLESGLLEFESIHRILESILSQKKEAFQSSSLHGIKFASLKSALPADVIVLMGMDESAFPRAERKSSLYEVEGGGYDPKLMDQDRYLFLELFLSARKHFITTYCYLDEEDGKERVPSLVLEEMRAYLPQVEIKKHEEREFEKLKKQPPPQILTPERSEYLVDIRHLKRLAHNPIQFFFEKTCGIYFEKKASDNADFVLPRWEVAALRKSSEDLTTYPKLPEGRFRDAALDYIQQEREDYNRVLERLGVENVFSIEFKVGCDHPIEWRENEWIYPPLKIGRATLIGKLDDVSPQGILFYGENRLEDCIKAWPLLLLMSYLPIQPRLLLTEEGKAKENFFPNPEEAFLRYLTYYERALETPSPLTLTAARSILREGKLPENELFDWSTDWIPFLRETFHETV
jgi:exonuclease V gamma subunit